MIEAGDSVLVVSARGAAADAAPGDSIAVDGACLTCTGIDGDSISFEVSSETYSRTIAGSYAPGRAVNIESSLRIGDKVGGHLVTGHIDHVGTVSGIERSGGFAVLSVLLPSPEPGLVAVKGSITVSGVSLTVANFRGNTISVALVPTTLAGTTLGRVEAGDPVNIEYDIIARYLLAHLRGGENHRLSGVHLV